MKPLSHLALFLTESCNLACPYCFAANMERQTIDLDLARRAVDLLLEPASEAKQVSVSFWGGEPLLDFETLKELVLYAEGRAAAQDRSITFSVPTNLTLLDAEMIAFARAHQVGLSLSLDGDEAAQSLRVFKGGRSSYPAIVEKLELIKAHYGKNLPPVRMTVSPSTARDFFRHVRFFLDQGLNHVYFAPVVEAPWPDADLAALEAEQLKLADHWMAALEAGERMHFPTWDKVLAWRALRRRGRLALAPRLLCGAGDNMLAVDIYGDLYPCHRFVFYDKAQRAQALGSVDGGLPAQAVREEYVSVDEARLGTATQRCAQCPDEALCFVFCPALNYSLGGDIHVVDERVCHFARLEQRVLNHVEQSLGDDPKFQQYVESYLLKVFFPGAASAEIAAVFAGLTAQDTDRLADRAAEILERLQRRGRGLE